MSGGTLDGTGSTILGFRAAQMNLDGGPDGNNQFTIDGGADRQYRRRCRCQLDWRLPLRHG